MRENLSAGLGKDTRKCNLRIIGSVSVHGKAHFCFWECSKIKASQKQGIPQNRFLGIWEYVFGDCLHFWGTAVVGLYRKADCKLRKKNYKGRCEKRKLSKCGDDVCKTYDAIQYAYADVLNHSNDIDSFRTNVLLEGVEEDAYTTDFVITKSNGDLAVRECVERKHLSKPMTAKLLDISRSYWQNHGVTDWGIVINKGE